MKAIPLGNHGDTRVALRFVCSDCGRDLMAQDIEKQWGKCEFCGDLMCTACSHYLGTITRGLWKDYINVRRVCRKCVIRL